MAFRGKSLRILGLAQIVIGILMVLFGIASIFAVHYWTSYIACGIWVGVWVILTGVFAYLGANSDTHPNNCLIGVMIGFAVTGCVLAGIMVIMSSISLSEFSHRLRCQRYIERTSYSTPYYRSDGYDCYYSYGRRQSTYSTDQTGAAISSLLLILAVVEFFVALASSIYGCNACCCTSPTIQAQQQLTYLQQPGGNVIVINPHGVVPAGQAVQTINAYPGQAVPVMYSQQPQQGYVASPQAVPQQGYPVQPYQAYPANAQVAGGAVARQQPQQAFQPQQNKAAEEMPPPYNFSGQ